MPHDSWENVMWFQNMRLLSALYAVRPSILAARFVEEPDDKIERHTHVKCAATSTLQRNP